jgi:hypothetical protein
MARRRWVISSSGGVGAGSPFVKDAATFVSQSSPPFINTSRLGRVSDAARSIIAPGDFAGATSFVLGRNVVDAVGGDRSTLVGASITQASTGAGQNVDQVLIGQGLAMPTVAVNAQGTVLIGNTMVLTAFAAAPSFGSNVGIGFGLTIAGGNGTNLDAQNNVVIGALATMVLSSGVVLGAGAKGESSEAIAIGAASLSGAQSVTIGAHASTTGQTGPIAIGRGAFAGDHDIAIGFAANAAGNAVSSLAMGYQATVAGLTNAMAFGREAAPGTNGMVLFGSVNFPTLFFRFGGGVNDSVGGNTYRLGTTDIFGGAGNNVTGNGLQVQAGVGTGNWPNTQNLGLDLQVGIVGASGSAQQVYTSVLAMRHSDLNVAFWGGLAATFGGGAGVMFLKSATTVPTTNPTGGGLLYVTGANADLTYRNAAGTVTTLNGGGGGSFLPLAGGTMTGDILGNAAGARSIGTVAVPFLTYFGRNVQSDSGIGLKMASGSLIVAVAGVTVASLGSIAFFPADQSVQLGGTANRWNGLWVDGTSNLPFTITNATTTVGASVGTLTNSPTAGNPTGYLQVKINGVTGKIPYWT